jgi:hypothetical protein
MGLLYHYLLPTLLQHTGFWWGNLSERNLLDDLVVDGRRILKWIFKKWDAEA